MVTAFHLDFETSSACDIGLGSYRYAADPSTRILMFAIAEGHGEPVLWDFLNPDSPESAEAVATLRRAVESGALIYAHNAQFEVAVCEYCLLRDTGISPPSLDQWRCTLAMCRRAAAPESLAAAAEFFGLGNLKNPVGKGLIDLFSDRSYTKTLVPPAGMKDPATIRPMKNGGMTKGKKPNNRKSVSPVFDTPILWQWETKVAGSMLTVSAAWEQFKEYCRQDVRVEQSLHTKLGHFELRGDVLASFQFDLRMNWRGVPVNMTALKNAQDIVESLQQKLAARFEQMTGLQPSQRDRKLEWLRERGYPEDNLQAGTVEKILANPPESMTPLAVQVLTVHSLLSFSALSKIPTMIASAGPDHRVRGTMQWHAARTGRAGGRIIQPQNFKKSTIGADAHVCYTMMQQGCPPSWFEDLWESPLEAIASSIRHFIQPQSGSFFDADYSQVEARITPWLCGDYEKLKDVVNGIDLYKRTASMIFNKPYEEITKAQRTDAKPVELGCCIAAGELVLTQRGEVPIEAVLLDDLVWDGVEWVRHEGVIYQGVREVLTYQGLTATEDHEVWVEEATGKVPLRTVVDRGYTITITGAGRTPIRRLDPDEPTGFQGGGIPQSDSPVPVRGVCSQLRGLAEERVQPEMRRVQGCEEKDGAPSMVGSPVPCGEGEMRESESQAVQSLRRSGGEVPVRVASGWGPVGHGEPGTAEGHGDRPRGQRRPLRAGEYPVGQQVRADEKQPANPAAEGLRVRGAGVALLQGHRGETGERGDDTGSDTRPSEGCHSPEDEKLEEDRRKVPTYDLLNAGPRHRFTVSGKLVSNCFGVGGKGLRDAMAKPPYNLVRTLAQCREYVRKYRDGHPKTVQAWRDIEEAAKNAITRPGMKFTACENRLEFVCGKAAGIMYLTMRLPSGRRLYYPHPKVKATFKRYDEEEMEEDPWKRQERGYWIDQISFYGKLRESNHWGRVATWGSRLFENAVQAIGADLLNRGCVEAERRGYPICMIVHDQAISEDIYGTVEGFVEALCVKDPWAETFPLGASGDLTPYYLKED